MQNGQKVPSNRLVSRQKWRRASEGREKTELRVKVKKRRNRAELTTFNGGELVSRARVITRGEKNPVNSTRGKGQELAQFVIPSAFAQGLRVNEQNCARVVILGLFTLATSTNSETGVFRNIPALV